VSDAVWEDYQIAHLNDDGPFRIECKSRQIAWSFTVAAEAVADAILDERDTVFVSINLEEAKEKVRYARRVYDNLQTPFALPGLRYDNVLGLEFDNGARITSLPSRPPRGRARANVVLDEFAHVLHDNEVYTAALPIISKGGRLRIGSSPLGQSGRFWDVFDGKYGAFTRVTTPWWKARSFLHRIPVDSTLPAAEMVARYGNARIQGIYAALSAEEFAQEYCCEFVDESSSYFPWELIRSCVGEHDFYYGDALEIRRMLPGVKLYAGMDVGRKHHASEIVLMTADGVVVANIALDKMPFQQQIDEATQLYRTLDIGGFYIDRGGLGMQMAEELSWFATGFDFTNQSKQELAQRVRIALERRQISLPNERDLLYQIYSIRRSITAANNIRFEAAEGEKHHGDKFWALALAMAAREAESGVEFSSIVI